MLNEILIEVDHITKARLCSPTVLTLLQVTSKRLPNLIFGNVIYTKQSKFT